MAAQVCMDKYGPAISTVTAVGPSFRTILFPSKTDTSVATISRLDVNLGLINKHIESSIYAYLSFILPEPLKFYMAVDLAKEGVVSTYTDILTWEKFGASLAHQN